MADSTASQTEIVVKAHHDGNLLPSKIEELERRVIIEPGASIDGGVFGAEIRVKGPSRVSKAVYATCDLIIEATGDVVFSSCIGSRRTLRVTSGGGNVRVGGDVIAAVANLQDCVVLGGVHAENVYLQNCVVLGPVMALGEADLRDSCFLTARADRLTFKGDCGLVLPYAQARSSLVLESPVRILSISKGREKLSEEDIIKEEGHIELSIGQRVTDWDQVRSDVENIRNFLLKAVLGEAVLNDPGKLEVDTDRVPWARKHFSEILHSA